MTKLPRIPPMLNVGNLMPQVPPDLQWDPDNPMMINSCSGHTDVHAAECDGVCERRAVDEYDVRIENENRAWARAGLNMTSISSNPLRLDARLQTIVQLVMQRLDISDEEFNAIFRPMYLDTLVSVRHNLQEAMGKAKIRSNIILPDIVQ